jgi:hypothetical protein
MDGGYGQYPQVRNWMTGHALPYVVATSAALLLIQTSVAPGTTAITRADDLPARLADSDWQRRSGCEGSKGDRYYDWALIGLGGNLHVSDETPVDHHRVHVRPSIHRRATRLPARHRYQRRHRRHRGRRPGHRLGKIISAPPARPAGPDWLSADLLTRATVADVRNLLAQTVLHAATNHATSCGGPSGASNTRSARESATISAAATPYPETLRKWVKRSEVIQV